MITQKRTDSTATTPPASNNVYQTYLQSLAPSGRKGIASLLNRCTEFLNADTSASHYAWQTLNYAQVEHLRNALLDYGYAVSSVNMALAALRGLSQTAFNLRLMDSETFTRIKAVKRVRGDSHRKGRSLTKQEIQAMLRGADQAGLKIKKVRDKAIVLTLCGAGLRASELVSLDVGDIDVTNGKLTVKQGKGRKYRAIYLPKAVVSAIKNWLDLRGVEPGTLFKKLTKSGILGYSALSQSGLTAILEELRVKAGVAYFSPHDLRRTFITQLLETGVDINTVRQLAGHADIATTARYDCRGELAKMKASRGFSCW